MALTLCAVEKTLAADEHGYERRARSLKTPEAFCYPHKIVTPVVFQSPMRRPGARPKETNVPESTRSRKN